MRLEGEQSTRFQSVDFLERPHEVACPPNAYLSRTA